MILDTFNNSLIFQKMKSTAPLTFVILLLFHSCSSNQKQPPPLNIPEVVEARGYVVPADSITAPKVTPVQKPKLVVAKKPRVVPVVTNVVPAGKPTTRIAGKPRVFTSDSFLISNREGETLHPYIPVKPEEIVAKYAAIKSSDPHSLSSFGKLQGLESAEISGLVEDKMGNLWISTNSGGITKYDGKNFTHYTIKEGLANNYVWCLLQDKNDNLWVSTVAFGLSRFNGNNFTNFKSKGGSLDNSADKLYEDKAGNIWFSTIKGLNKFDGKVFTTHPANDNQRFDTVFCFGEDANGNLCIGTVKGLNIYDGKSFSVYGRKEGLNSDTVGSIMKDALGNLWLGEYNRGITKFDGTTFTSFTTKEGLTDNNVISMLQDKQGNYWFGTQNGGVNKYDNKNFTHFTTKEGLSSNTVRCILEDRHGNIWFGTAEGLNKYDGRTFTHITETEGLSDKIVMSLAQDKYDNMWFGTWEGGVNKYDGKTFSHFTMEQGMRNDAVADMLIDKSGNLWFGDYTGICKFDGKVFTHFAEKAMDVFSILQDKSGNIWFGTFGNGAFKYDGVNFTHYTQKEGLSDNYLCKVLEDKSGHLWFASYGGGITKYDGKNFVHFTEKTGLRDNFVYNIHEDKSGNIWIGYLKQGVSRYDGKKFIHLNETNGLSNNEVRAIMEDSHGNIWFGTNSGVSKLEKNKAKLLDNVQAPESLTRLNHYFKTYSYEDGFYGIEVSNRNAIFEAKDGNIWIGAGDRLTSFHPEGETEDTIAPNIQLTGVMLFNEGITWQNYTSETLDGKFRVKDTSILLGNGATLQKFHFDGLSKWYGIPGNLSLAYNNNNLTLQYVGITIQSPKKVKYQYQLKGFDNNWSAITDRTEATYSNLPHGSYTFKVKAMNGDGYWSKEFAYPFTIRPPWWHTWWAYALFTIASLSLIYAAFRYRLNEVRRQHEIKHRTAALEMQALRAQMNPHFIFNSLNAINLFILENNKQQASDYLSKFSKLVRLILNNSREAFIPLEQELEALTLYLELESLRFDEKFTYDISVEDGIDNAEIKVPPLIIQPYVENAIWHGLMNKKDKGKLQIELYLEDTILFCRITDDGIGRKKAAEYKSKGASQKKSMGMRITADRIAMLQDQNDNGKHVEVKDLVLADGSPGGTEVTLKIPVSYD
jgi:ligand-binding sensor domain-containing protein